MKATIDFDLVVADHEWESMVGEVVRDEVRGEIRRQVKSILKDENKEVSKRVALVSKRLMEELVKKPNYAELVEQMLGRK